MNDETDQWYLSRDGSQRGPIPWEEVKSLHDAGQIAPDDLLWRPGFEDWKTAAEVFPPAPPPLPRPRTRQAAAASEPVSRSQPRYGPDGPAIFSASPEETPQNLANMSATSHVVQPKSDFQLVGGGQQLVYNAETQDKPRRMVAQLLISFLLLIGISAGVFGVFAGREGAGLILVCVACIILVFFIYLWSTKAIIEPITIDSSSITVRGKTYLLNNISSIGWQASSGWSGSDAARLAHELSGQVHIQYGADRIPIITGLHPDRTEQVYSRIVEFLRRFGHQYGS